MTLAALPVGTRWSAAAVDAVARLPVGPLPVPDLFFAFYLGCEAAGDRRRGGGALASGAGSQPDAAATSTWNFRLALLVGADPVRGSPAPLRGASGRGGARRPRQPGRSCSSCATRASPTRCTPAVLVSSRRGVRLRYVIKRELLWDPCLDIVGNRSAQLLRAAARLAATAPSEIAAVRRLADDLGPGEGIFVDRRARDFRRSASAGPWIAFRRQGDAELVARAEQLRNVLPPRLGGTLTLLDVENGADVVFCVHFGFDGVRSFQRPSRWGADRSDHRGGVLAGPGGAHPQGSGRPDQLALRSLEPHGRLGGESLLSFPAP